MYTAIIIPARYQSTRLPGKPLVKIGGKTMLQRVIEIAQAACQHLTDTSVSVATDDERILAHAESLNVHAIMTPKNCINGTDRVLAAAKMLSKKPDFIMNLQGDAPLTPPHFITQLIQALHDDNKAAIATPIVQLSWEALDVLRHYKKETPFSGTTVVSDKNNYALWFSKQIIPAIRQEKKLRGQSALSPVFRHIGLYGYQYEALAQYARLEESYYESLEGLEQLRALENHLPIKTVTVSYNGLPEMTGIDTPEDVERANQLFKQYGEIIK